MSGPGSGMRVQGLEQWIGPFGFFGGLRLCAYFFKMILERFQIIFWGVLHLRCIFLNKRFIHFRIWSVKKKGCQISLSRDFSKNQEKIRQNRPCPKNWDFCVFAKQAMSKKLGLSPKFITHTSPNFRSPSAYESYYMIRFKSHLKSPNKSQTCTYETYRP